MGSNWGLVIDGILSRRAERNEKRLQAKLQNACPHASIEPHGDDFKIISHYVSPPGTTIYTCERCGDQTYSISSFHDYLSQADKNVVEQLTKKNRAFTKLLKKHGFV